MNARLSVIHIFVGILALASTLTVVGQRTTRTKLHPASADQTKTPGKDYDTIFVASDTADIVFSGYEKTLRATKESFFVNNRTDSIIDRLVIAITYKDMNGRELDCRTSEIDIILEPASTRRIDLPAWDKQKVFYYYLSPTPRTSRATPYKVAISTVAALRRR